MINNILWFFAQQCAYAVHIILLVHAVLRQQRVTRCHVHSTWIIIHFSSSKKIFTYRYSVGVYIVPSFNHREMTVYVLRRTISFPYTGAHPHRTVWNFPCLRIMTPRLSDVLIIMPLHCTYQYLYTYTIRVRVVLTKRFTLMCKNALTNYKQTIGIL